MARNANHASVYPLAVAFDGSAFFLPRAGVRFAAAAVFRRRAAAAGAAVRAQPLAYSLREDLSPGAVVAEPG